MITKLYSLLPLFESITPVLFLLGFVFSFATCGFLFLKFVDQGNSKALKRIFSIPARKSTTNAIQLGGLPLSLAMMSGLTLCLVIPGITSYFSFVDQTLIKYWLVSSTIVVLYGHLDDKYELRPIVKVMMQVVSVCLFTLLASQSIFPRWSSLAFVVLSFWGMGVLNGSNLLDGLDTLTIKLGSVTMSSYLFIGLYYQLPDVMVTSSIALSALVAFYYFNKEPAQIHLGEIGGSFVGFVALLNSCLLFKGLTQGSAAFSTVNIFSLSIIPLSLPMIELSISFSRRLYNRKSPFSGDKYHLHHILRNYHDLTPSNASSVFAAGHLLCLSLGFGTLVWSDHPFAAVIGFFVTNIGLVSSYLAIGAKHWQGQNVIKLRPAALFDYLRKKDVAVISSQECDEFKLEILTDSEPHEFYGLDEDDDDIAA
jgi:UDP-N-acetylmuramyl pentapeptide phosphotransferase/UDP-N-acetylglucosamine-1-phosphate transferase